MANLSPATSATNPGTHALAPLMRSGFGQAHEVDVVFVSAEIALKGTKQGEEIYGLFHPLISDLRTKESVRTSRDYR